MKTEKYYTSEEISGMQLDELRHLAEAGQAELEHLRWRIKEAESLLIAALQSLPKIIEL